MERCLRNHELIRPLLLSREEQVAHATAHVQLSLKYCAILSHAERYLSPDPDISKPLQSLRSVCK